MGTAMAVDQADAAVSIGLAHEFRTAGYRVWPGSRDATRREPRVSTVSAESEDSGVDAAGLDDALNAARRGDERGIAELWTVLNPLILRYLRVLVGQAAEDVASETWLQAARDVRGFRGDAAGFRVWLFRVARNRALDELRRSGRRLEDPVGLPGDSPGAPRARPAPDDTAAEAVERMSTERALQLIAQLPKNQAEAVMLRVIIGLDGKQSADVLGKRAGAVRIAAMRGLRSLSGLLTDEELDASDVPDASGTPDLSGAARRDLGARAHDGSASRARLSRTEGEVTS
jgi:RNA polymerase sigma-70 factor (ECF subfamily)